VLEVLKKFRARNMETAAALKVGLAEIDLATLARAVDEAMRRRDRLLLDGNDKEVLAAEAEISSARIAFDRGKALRQEIERRIVDAEVIEAKAALDAERDRVDAEAAAVAADLQREYPKLQEAMTNLLERVDASDTAVQAVNEKLGNAGRGDERLEGPEWRARPRPVGQWEGAVSLGVRTVLPAIEEWGLTGYGGMMAPAPVVPRAAPTSDSRADQSTPTPLVAAPAGGIIFPRT
jgi:hypothetical protein